MSKQLIIRIFKECFYRREIEIFRVGVTNEYGIREVWRSRVKTPDGVSGWRRYSRREGDKVQMTGEQMKQLLRQAEIFADEMK